MNEQLIQFHKALTTILNCRSYRLRFRALWRSLRGVGDLPNQLPERFLNINFFSQFQSDIVRQLWREHHNNSLEFSTTLQDMGPHLWPPKMDRYIMLWQLVRSTLNLPGDIVEFGVYKGVTARLIAKSIKVSGAEKMLYLLDTFMGLPEPSPGLDAEWKKGDLGDTTLIEVQVYLADIENVTFLPGLFSDSFFHLESKQFCFSHVDCDLYASVKECCEFIYPRTVPGGFIVFDDYGVPYCPGAKLAVNQFFADKPEQLIYLPTAQCIIIKGN